MDPARPCKDPGASAVQGLLRGMGTGHPVPAVEGSCCTQDTLAQAADILDQS